MPVVPPSLDDDDPTTAKPVHLSKDPPLSNVAVLVAPFSKPVVSLRSKAVASTASAALFTSSSNDVWSSAKAGSPTSSSAGRPVAVRAVTTEAPKESMT